MSKKIRIKRSELKRLVLQEERRVRKQKLNESVDEAIDTQIIRAKTLLQEMDELINLDEKLPDRSAYIREFAIDPFSLYDAHDKLETYVQDLEFIREEMLGK